MIALRKMTTFLGISRNQIITNNIYCLIQCLITNIKTINIFIYCTLFRKTKKRRSLIITEILHNQVILSDTNLYWKMLDKYYQYNYKKYQQYINENSYEKVLKRQKNLIIKIERVIKDNNEELDIYRRKYDDLTWVMSTGRCGVDALDNFFKKSENHCSIHREFDENEFFENDSALTTKSYVFNKFLFNNATDLEIYQIIIKFIKKRIKTIEKAKGKSWIFCEHNDTPWLPIIVRIFPSSKIIHLAKNPEDVIQSYLSKSLYNSCQEVPLNLMQTKLAFNSLVALSSWFYTYINMFIYIHCKLIDNQNRVLRIRGENLLKQDINTYKKLNSFLKLNSSESEYIETFSHRYNAKIERIKYSKFPNKNNWPVSFHLIVNMFYLNIESILHK